MTIKFSKYRDEQHGRGGDRFTHLVSFSELPKFVFFHPSAGQSQAYLVPLEAENDSPNILGIAPRPIQYGSSDGVLWLFDETSINSLFISGEWIDTGGLQVQSISWNGKKCYYRVICANGDVFESNVFQFANITNLAYPQEPESLLKFVFSQDRREINTVLLAGIPHESVLFLNGFLENPIFLENIESETDGTGRVIQVFSRIEKVYSVRVIVPEYIYTALLEMNFCENRKLYDGRMEYEIMSLVIEKEFFCKENGFEYFVLNLKMSLDAMFG
jgi:hypothetical protein